MNGTGELVKEIRKLQEEGDLGDSAALRLILAANAETLEYVQKIDARVKQVAETQERYPSLLWLLVHRPKPTVAAIVGFMSLLTVAYVYEIRHAVVELLLAAFGI